MMWICINFLCRRVSLMHCQSVDGLTDFFFFSPYLVIFWFVSCLLFSPICLTKFLFISQALDTLWMLVVFIFLCTIFAIQGDLSIARYSNTLNTSSSWLASFLQKENDYHYFQEYNEILIKRIQQLQQIRDRPDQFTVLVREIPFCTEHKARACSADHFFSKYYPHDYHSYQILYNGKDVEELMVSF